MQQGSSHKLKATISILHHRPGRLWLHFWNSSLPCAAAGLGTALPVSLSSSAHNAATPDPGSFLSAECLATALWGHKVKFVLTSFFKVKIIFFLPWQLNQLFLATKTSKSGISQLLSEIINANHLWFVCIRDPSPSYTGGSTGAFRLNIQILPVSNCLTNLSLL